MKINKAWHMKNPMAEKATFAQRIGWHLEHSKQCGCGRIPNSISLEIEKRRELNN